MILARIGFVGTGTIAAAMVQGLGGQGHSILVSPRNATVAADLAARFQDVSVVPNQDVLDGSDIVFLCLLASLAETALTGLHFRPDHKVVSVMVDVNHATLVRLCAPAHEIATTIPMPFIAQGGCPLPVYPASAALALVFGQNNTILPVTSERALNAHFGGAAQVAAVLAQMREGAVWLGEQTGDANGAEAYVAAMFAGTLAELPKDGRGRFDNALDALNTEGGLNATLRAHMAKAGMLAQLRSGLDGLKARLGLG
jgi:pyrroline-5-carboxylate reductase